MSLVESFVRETLACRIASVIMGVDGDVRGISPLTRLLWNRAEGVGCSLTQQYAAMAHLQVWLAAARGTDRASGAICFVLVVMRSRPLIHKRARDS